MGKIKDANNIEWNEAINSCIEEFNKKKRKLIEMKEMRERQLEINYESLAFYETEYKQKLAVFENCKKNLPESEIEWLKSNKSNINEAKHTIKKCLKDIKKYDEEIKKFDIVIAEAKNKLKEFDNNFEEERKL